MHLGEHFRQLGVRLTEAGFGDDTFAIVNNYATGVQACLDTGFCPRCGQALGRVAVFRVGQPRLPSEVVISYRCTADDCTVELERIELRTRAERAWAWLVSCLRSSAG